MLIENKIKEFDKHAEIQEWKPADEIRLFLIEALKQQEADTRQEVIESVPEKFLKHGQTLPTDKLNIDLESVVIGTDHATEQIKDWKKQQLSSLSSKEEEIKEEEEAEDEFMASGGADRW